MELRIAISSLESRLVPSVQNDRLRSSSPTLLQCREKHLALVTKAEPFQLLTLSGYGFLFHLLPIFSIDVLRQSLKFIPSLWIGIPPLIKCHIASLTRVE